MIAGQCENRHRHADQIIQIAWCRQRRSEQRANDGGGEFLGGRLADCATDCDEWQCTSGAAACEMPAREHSQRAKSVGDLDAIESRMMPASRDDRGYRATRRCQRQIVMAVRRFATQRDEY